MDGKAARVAVQSVGTRSIKAGTQEIELQTRMKLALSGATWPKPAAAGKRRDARSKARKGKPDLFSGFMVSEFRFRLRYQRVNDSRMKGQVQLRDVEADDLRLFFEHQRDPIAVALVGFQSRDRAAFDQHWEKLLANDSCLKKTIVADGKVAGNIGSWLSDGKREIGYWIDRTLWGRGIATEALSAFLRLEQTRPLHAGVAKHNAASIRVLQKCGFTLLGPEETAPDPTEASHVLLRLDA